MSMKRGGRPLVLVTIEMSAQFLNVSGWPQPTASVPLSQVPHILPSTINENDYIICYHI